MTEFTVATAPPASARWAAGRVMRHAVLARRRGGLLALGTAGLVSHQVCEALVPALIGLTIDYAVLTGDAGALLRWLAVLAVLFLVLSFSWRMGARRLVRVVAFGSHDLRLMATRRVLDPHRPAPRRPAGEVLSITSSDADRVAELSWVLAQTIAVCAGLATATVALLAMSVPLGLAVVAAAPAVLLAMHLLARPLEARSENEQEQAAAAGALAADLVQGVRVLKGIGAESAAADRYRAVSRTSVTAALRAARAKAGYDGLGEVLSDIVLAGVALAASWMALNGQLQIGELVTVVGLAQFIRGPMTALGGVGVSVAQKRASAGRVATLLNDEAETAGASVDAAGTSGVTATGGSDGGSDVQIPAMEIPAVKIPTVKIPAVEIPAVRIAAPGGDAPPVVIRSGQVVGIVGTAADVDHLLAVLSAREPARQGEIVVQGIDLAALSPAQVRQLVFVADREATLFSGTLADNLYAGSAAAAVDPHAVRAAAADELLARLGDGLSTVLAEQGRNLSGGQRQRVLLARALHRDQPILVLHEPTTAVDSVTEARIGAALRDRSAAAILLVTASPALLASCHCVIAVGQGRWKIGTHADLLVTDPDYRALVRA